MPAKLNVQAQSYNLAVEVRPSLAGDAMLHLTTSDGNFTLNLPAAFWPWLNPGDIAYLTIGAMKVTLEEAADSALSLPDKRIILPGEIN